MELREQQVYVACAVKLGRAKFTTYGDKSTGLVVDDIRRNRPEAFVEWALADKQWVFERGFSKCIVEQKRPDAFAVTVRDKRDPFGVVERFSSIKQAVDFAVAFVGDRDDE